MSLRDNKKMSETFKPAWWLPNAHAQTLWGIYFRKPPNIPLNRERLELPDGDFLDLDWYDQADKTKPIFLILHGLAGSINSHYAKGLMKVMHKEGWRTVFMHFRGCSEEPNRLPRGYHAADTPDLDAVIRTLQSRQPKQKIAVMGISMGGMVLLHWLNQTTLDNPVTAAIAVSTPFDVEKGIEYVRKNPLRQYYEKVLVRDMKKYMLKKFRSIRSPYSIDEIEKIKNCQEFDDLITAPMYGFKNAKHYYDNIRLIDKLNKINKPTLIIHAKDDPLVPPEAIPTARQLSSSIHLELQQHGGHVGFVTDESIMSPVYWIEKRAPQFLKQFL